MAYFDLDLEPIRQRCLERGDVAHNRYPIRDFDPFDLRRKLAGAVQLVADQARQLQGTGKKVYIHCTAGTHQPAQELSSIVHTFRNLHGLHLTQDTGTCVHAHRFWTWKHALQCNARPA